MMQLRLWNLVQATSSKFKQSFHLLWSKKSENEKDFKQEMTTEVAMKQVIVTYKIVAMDEYQISVISMCRVNNASKNYHF